MSANSFCGIREFKIPLEVENIERMEVERKNKRGYLVGVQFLYKLCKKYRNDFLENSFRWKFVINKLNETVEINCRNQRFLVQLKTVQKQMVHVAVDICNGNEQKSDRLCSLLNFQ